MTKLICFANDATRKINLSSVLEQICSFTFDCGISISKRIKDLKDGEYEEYRNNRLLNKFIVIDKKLEGPFIHYGDIDMSFTGNFVNGLAHGIFTFYLYRNLSITRRTTTYKKGLLHGDETEYYHKNKCMVAAYRNNIKRYTKNMDKDGNIEDERSITIAGYTDTYRTYNHYKGLVLEKNGCDDFKILFNKKRNMILIM